MPRMRSVGLQLEAIAPGGSGMPLYRAVKRALLAALESGRVAPGQALPAEKRLAALLGVPGRREVQALAGRLPLPRRAVADDEGVGVRRATPLEVEEAGA